MTKRKTHDNRESGSKRAKVQPQPDPIRDILDNADQLIDCLRELKDGRQPPTLKQLCKSLLPAFTQLSAAGDDASEPDMTLKLGNSAIPPDSPALRAPVFGGALTPWNTSQISNNYPPLPPVADPSLEKAAFTHRGLCKPGEMHYERLEWIGDAYMELFASGFIFQTLPQCSPGRSSQLREMLVKNETLSGYAGYYGFDQRARMPSDCPLASMARKERTKVLGDMMEAYTGAIILSDPGKGVDTAISWLKALWGTTIKGQLAQELSATRAPIRGPQTNPPKQELARRILTSGVRMRYDDVPTQARDPASGLPLFAVAAVVEERGVKSQRLGVGEGMSKAEAGQNAAREALNSTGLNYWVGRKEEFLAKIRKQKQT